MSLEDSKIFNKPMMFIGYDVESMLHMKNKWMQIEDGTQKCLFI